MSKLSFLDQAMSVQILADALAHQQLSKIMRQVALQRAAKTTVSMNLMRMASRPGHASPRARTPSSSGFLPPSTATSSTSPRPPAD